MPGADTEGGRLIGAGAERPRRRPGWLLLAAALIAAAAGGAYLWQWTKGLRGIELLGFTSIWVALPLALAMLLLFVYFARPARR